MLYDKLNLLFVILTFSASSCSYFFSDSVVVLNNSGDTVVECVKAAGNVVWEGKLDSGKSTKFRFAIDRDGALELDGKIGERLTGSGKVGYVTPNAGAHHRFEITQEKSVKYALLE